MHDEWNQENGTSSGSYTAADNASSCRNKSSNRNPARVVLRNHDNRDDETKWQGWWKEERQTAVTL